MGLSNRGEINKAKFAHKLAGLRGVLYRIFCRRRQAKKIFFCRFLSLFVAYTGWLRADSWKKKLAEKKIGGKTNWWKKFLFVLLLPLVQL